MSSSDSSMTTDSNAGDSGSSSDAPADTAKGEAGQGQDCDIKNDNCGAGLKCCSEPTHMMPPTHDICVPPQQDGTCPKYP